jgi:hypothetical protein
MLNKLDVLLRSEFRVAKEKAMMGEISNAV